MINQSTQANTQITKLKIKQNNNSKQNNNPSFGGPVEIGTGILNGLNTNPAVGACFIDFFSMVMPRTLVDFSRSKDAGMETGFRESSGTVNHALAGIVGLGAWYAVSAAFNKSNGVKAHLIFANSDTIDTFGKFIESSKTANGYDSHKYWNNVFENIEGLNTTDGNNVWKNFKEASPQKFEEVVNLLSKEEPKTYGIPKSTLARVSELVTGTTGAGSTFRVTMPELAENANSAKKELTKVEGSLEELVTSAYSLRKAVMDKTVADKTQVIENLESFLKGIKNRKMATVAAGLAFPITVGMSAQPLNRYLTKKRTGSDGFVGVEGRKPDKSFGFKVLKTVLGIGMGTAMISTILKHPADLYTHTKKALPEIAQNLQYKGLVPTINQFKFIYGMTIMSRIFAARDKNETRESAIKDSLGFANWLILGGFVSKLAAKAFNKGTVNYDEKTNGKGLWSYITKSVEKTHEEILYPILDKAGINVLDANGKKLPFRKLMSSVKDMAKGNGENAKLAQKALSQLKYKNYAQLLGYI